MFTLLWYNFKKMSKFIIFFSMQKMQNFKVNFEGIFLNPKNYLEMDP